MPPKATTFASGLVPTRGLGGGGGAATYFTRRHFFQECEVSVAHGAWKATLGFISLHGRGI